jgi:two-component system phosphate regulon response regulator PhoB
MPRLLQNSASKVLLEAPLPSLTPTEFRVLDLLISEPGRVFTRAELTSRAMPDSVVLERTVDVHVKSLRRKLGPLAAAVRTVRGVGYRFAMPATQ